MKRMVALCALALSGVVSIPAQAHGYYGGWRGGHHYHGGGHHWVGPVLGAALIGGAIYAASTPSYATTQIITVPPAPPVVSGPRIAYYCSSWGQYYPQVQNCPVPWQPVPF